MSRLSDEAAAELVEATTGHRPGGLQANRVARTVGAMARTMDAMAPASLFDTEPSQLDATLVELADDYGISS